MKRTIRNILRQGSVLLSMLLIAQSPVFAGTLADTGSYSNEAAKSVEIKNTLSDLKSQLENKDVKTKTDEVMLDAMTTVMQESEYLDSATLKEFEQAVQAITAARSTKGALNESDSAAIENALTSLVKDRKDIYNTCLKSAEDAYNQLAELLSVDPSLRMDLERKASLNT